MTKYITNILPVLLLLLCQIGISQESKKELIAKSIHEYFAFDRENIHAHLDKNVFLTNEAVWFKGYVFHRKKGIPFFSSTNIFARLLNNEGEVLETQLLFGSVGNFSGKFNIKDTYKPGRYFIQFYTNWMNNFIEDESSIYPIHIIDDEIGAPDYILNNNYTEPIINVYPESGLLLKNTNNIVAVTVLNCQGKPIGASEAEIVDEDGETVKYIGLDKSGYSKFNFVAKKQNYKLVTEINGIKYEQPLPSAQENGITIETDSYTLPDKVLIKVKTNENSMKLYSGKSFYLLIHKDEKTDGVEFNFSNNNLEQTALISNDSLSEGLNTIRLIDEKNNQIAERLIYIYPKKAAFTTEVAKAGMENGFLNLIGKTNLPAMNLSVSIVPEKSLSILETADIYTDLLINPYLENKQNIPGRQFFTDISETVKYQMDLFLLCQSSKYKWSNIIGSPPKSDNTFDIGLSLKGTINKSLKPLKDYKVRVYSITGMFDEIVDINEKNEFFLNNLIIPDSTNLNFALLKKGVKTLDLDLYPQVSNYNRKFNKPFKPVCVLCSNTKNPVTTKVIVPKYAVKGTLLEEVKIDKKRAAETKLKYGKVFGNYQLKAYKITKAETNGFPMVLDFIRYHGFKVTNKPDSAIAVYGTIKNSFWGQKTTPELYIDNMRQIGFDILRDLRLEDIDEFYVNRHAVVSSFDNKMGIIKIYRKKDFSDWGKDIPDNSFLLKEGFKKTEPFKNADYMSTNDEGFENFGLINWQPLITTDEKGEFEFSVPKTYSGEVRIIIEGISPDGKILSEEKTITL